MKFINTAIHLDLVASPTISHGFAWRSCEHPLRPWQLVACQSRLRLRSSIVVITQYFVNSTLIIMDLNFWSVHVWGSLSQKHELMAKHWSSVPNSALEIPKERVISQQNSWSELVNRIFSYGYGDQDHAMSVDLISHNFDIKCKFRIYFFGNLTSKMSIDHSDFSNQHLSFTVHQ